MILENLVLISNKKLVNFKKVKTTFVLLIAQSESKKINYFCLN